MWGNQGAHALLLDWSNNATVCVGCDGFLKIKHRIIFSSSTPGFIHKITDSGDLSRHLNIQVHGNIAHPRVETEKYSDAHQ